MVSTGPVAAAGLSGARGGPSSLKLTVLVAARAAQREGFEWRDLAVPPHRVVIGDFDRCHSAGMRPGIDGKCREAAPWIGDKSGTAASPFRARASFLLR